MHVWLLNICEPLPSDTATTKVLRTGLLAESLLERGHNVTWWSSTFDHARKQQRADYDTSIMLANNFCIKLIWSSPYRKNISLNRLINHWQIGWKFERLAKLEAPPDIIFTTIPTLELTWKGVEYSNRKKIPVVVDIHDLWPDIFLDFTPKYARWFAKVLLFPYFFKTQKALFRSSSIIGVSESYLKWGLNYAKREKRLVDAIFPLGYRPISVSQSELENAESMMRSKGLDPSKTICWFIGIFGNTYDLSVVIEAARYLENNGIQHVQFVLSGHGDYYNKWHAQAKGLTNVIFTGWVDMLQIAYLMRIADIGLAAYAKDAPQGLPYKLFEYLCAGLPILSSLGGETKVLLDTHKCGFTYNANDTNILIKVLLELIENEPKRNFMGTNSAELFKKSYSVEHIYPKIVDLLENLVEESFNMQKT